MSQTLSGRSIGLLVTDGSDGALIIGIKAAVEAAGARATIVAPKIGGVTLKDGKTLKADRQLAGTPSVLFDAVAIVGSESGCLALTKDAAAISFASDSYAHLKAIGHSVEATQLLLAAGIEPDDGVFDLTKEFQPWLEAARERQWEREPRVRMLA